MDKSQHAAEILNTLPLGGMRMYWTLFNDMYRLEQKRKVTLAPVNPPWFHTDKESE